MATRKIKARKARAELVLRSFKITEEVQGVLTDLGRDMTDMLGREISQSAVLRGVVRWAGRQKGEWIREQLAPSIEEELDAGTIWGRKK